MGKGGLTFPLDTNGQLQAHYLPGVPTPAGTFPCSPLAHSPACAKGPAHFLPSFSVLAHPRPLEAPSTPFPGDAAPQHCSPGPAEHSSGCWVGTSCLPELLSGTSQHPASVSQSAEHYATLRRACWAPKGGRSELCNYVGGPRVCSRNSSILMKSVFSSLLNSKKGGLVPGARSFSSSGFLEWGKQEGSVPAAHLHPPASPGPTGKAEVGAWEGAQDQEYPHSLALLGVGRPGAPQPLSLPCAASDS